MIYILDIMWANDNIASFSNVALKKQPLHKYYSPQKNSEEGNAHNILILRPESAKYKSANAKRIQGYRLMHLCIKN